MVVCGQPSVPNDWRRTGYKLAKSLTMDIQKGSLITGTTPWFYTRVCVGLSGQVGNGTFPTSHGSIVPYLKPTTKFTKLLSFDRSLPSGVWDIVQLVKIVCTNL